MGRRGSFLRAFRLFDLGAAFCRLSGAWKNQRWPLLYSARIQDLAGTLYAHLHWPVHQRLCAGTYSSAQGDTAGTVLHAGLFSQHLGPYLVNRGRGTFLSLPAIVIPSPDSSYAWESVQCFAIDF